MVNQFGKKIQMNHFVEVNVKIDIYFNSDNDGILKIKRVGFSDDLKHEVLIKGINNCPENKGWWGKINGWIPHFVFSSYSRCEQKIQIARIDKSWYGMSKSIRW